MTPHVWRKTVATLLDEAGLNVGEIADQLGNTRAAVTEKDYIKAQVPRQEGGRSPRLDQANSKVAK